MLDNIISIVKDQVLNTVSNNTEVPAEKRESVVDTTTSTVIDGFKEALTSGNVSAITNLFSQEKVSENNDLTNNLKNSVISALSEKVGLSKDVANNIASVAIPAIIGLIQKKSNDPQESGFTIQSIIGALSKNSGGILGSIGSLFGK